MFGFDDNTYDMEVAIEQESFAEDMHFFPESVSAGQQAPEDAMQSWIEAFQDDQVLLARGVDGEVASVPPVPLGGSPQRSSGSVTSTLLPCASRACDPQDSALAVPNVFLGGDTSPTLSGSRRRLRGKRGDGQAARNALAASVKATLPGFYQT